MNKNQVITLCVATFLIGHFEATILEWSATKNAIKKLKEIIGVREMQVNALTELLNDINSDQIDPVMAKRKFDEAKEFINFVIEEI